MTNPPEITEFHVTPGVGCVTVSLNNREYIVDAGRAIAMCKVLMSATVLAANLHGNQIMAEKAGVDPVSAAKIVSEVARELQGKPKDDRERIVVPS